MVPKIVRAAVLSGAALLAACGGGDEGCAQTGPLTVAYVGERLDAASMIHYLGYRLGQTNSWALEIKGVTPACLAGLNVVPRSEGEDVPTGFTLDRATGRISTGVLSSHVEGTCVQAGGPVSGSSVNRMCPSGQIFMDRRTVLIVSSNHINTTAIKVSTPVSFEPKP